MSFFHRLFKLRIFVCYIFFLFSFKNYFKSYRNFVRLFLKNLKTFIPYDLLFFLINKFFFACVYIGINSFTASFSSNTYTSTQMDEIVCHLHCNCIFGGEHCVLYSISFVWLYGSHICSDDFCSTWSVVSVIILSGILDSTLYVKKPDSMEYIGFSVGIFEQIFA